MNCKHCGSSCDKPLPDEMTTEQSFSAIDQMADMRLKWITLSGGEPLTRKDWPQLAQRLTSKGVIANIISNGSLITDDVAMTMARYGINTTAISVDGPREVHDAIRKKGSFDKLEAGFACLNRAGVHSAAITTVTKENMGILHQIQAELVRMKVKAWQLQIGLPMGNLAGRRDWVLDPEQMMDLIDFCHTASAEGQLTIYPADCIGYYTHKELQIKQNTFNMPNVAPWDGCNAGKRSFGLLHNGDILGCTSIRNREFIEGNILQRPMRDIWEAPDTFLWCRDMTKDKLHGACVSCKYGERCLGGCPNTRMTMNGSIYSENAYCAYNTAIKHQRRLIDAEQDELALFSQSMDAIKEGELQFAALLLDRVTQLRPAHSDAWQAKGFAEFMIGNYGLCEEANRKALALEPQSAYARKGLGMAMFKLGKKDEGIALLEQVALESGYRDADVLNDLMCLYQEGGYQQKVLQLQAHMNSGAYTTQPGA